MATNRKRKTRISRRRIPANITPEYVRRLKCRDFMGELTEDEIALAKELGVYKWDAHIKECREERRNAE
jgi:hypothetical protein